MYCKLVPFTFVLPIKSVSFSIQVTAALNVRNLVEIFGLKTLYQTQKGDDDFAVPYYSKMVGIVGYEWSDGWK